MVGVSIGGELHMRTRTIIIWLIALTAFIAYGRFIMRDVGYVYEEIFPHLRVLPDTLERVPLGDGWRLSHSDYAQAPDGCRAVLATQWPTFALQCGEQVWPVLSETYQGEWVYYLSFAWQAVVGSSLPAIRLLAGLLFGLGLLLFFVVIRRESDSLTASVSTLLLGSTTIYLSSSAFAFFYECVPMLLAVASYGCWARGREGTGMRAWWLAGAVLCFFAALSLKATVGILVVPFAMLVWSERRLLRGLSWSWGLLLGAAVLPMAPFVVHEVLALMAGSQSTILYTLSARGELLGDASRLPSIFLDSFLWLLAFGGNINSTSRPVFGVDTLPWLRLDLVLLFGAGCVWATTRWVRGKAEMLEKFCLVAAGAAYVESVILYATDTEIQTFLYVVPFLAVLNGRFYIWLAHDVGQRMAGRWPSRSKSRVVLCVLVVLYTVQPVEIVLDSLDPPHVMASAAAQEEICGTLPAGSNVVTTNYNQIGALEHCSDNSVRPIHAYFLLSPGSTGEELKDDLQRGVNYLLDRWPDHAYLFDSLPARVWEAREGSVLAGEEEVTGLRLAAFKREVARRGGTLAAVAQGRNKRGETVLTLLRPVWPGNNGDQIVP